MSVAGAGGAGGVVRQGHLRKLKSMKRKFFVLRGETQQGSARLEYYESEKKFRSGAVPRRSLLLKSCFNINRRLDLKQRHVIALYTKEECFCVVSEGEDDLRAWLADLLKLHRTDDSIEELLHPTQHVWQVNVQKKGLGASKNIIGLYNLCLTDKTLTLVKIKANNNIIYETTIPERVEFSLKNIRRCGDSECFFYMEVGRLTTTGAGELWMHTDDANIAQSMHSTIYLAMSNCSKDEPLQPAHRNRSASATEDPRAGALSPRRQTYSDAKGRSGLSSSTANENDPPGLCEESKERLIKHHRTVSLPIGSILIQDPPRVCHERTRSAPLTGDEVDHATIDKVARHASCKTVNGMENCQAGKKMQWSRRASTGTRLSKLSPAHTKNVSIVRNRCDSMPSRACPHEIMEPERTPARHPAEITEGEEKSLDETDGGDWHRTPRIPEEPDLSYCDMTPGDKSVQTTMAEIEPAPDDVSPPCGYLPMAPTTAATGVATTASTSTAPMPADSGYVDVKRTLSPAASSGSVCSGTPSTDPRFSEYQLEPATAHILADEDERPPRAYSVGSRPAMTRPPPDMARMRAYSVGARTRHPPHHHPPATHHHNTPGKTSSSAPLLPRGSADDLMELDFSNNSPKTKSFVSQTPPSAVAVAPPRVITPRTTKVVAEYVDMSPGVNKFHAPTVSGQCDAPGPSVSIPRPSTSRVTMSRSPPVNVATTPDGYVEMNYGPRRPKEPTRPISIAPDRATPSTSTSNAERPSSLSATPIVSPSTSSGRLGLMTPLGSQTIFPLSLESPASPPRQADDRHDLEPTDVFDEEPTHHPLSTVSEAADESAPRSPDVGSPPHYVTLVCARTPSQPIAAPFKPGEADAGELSCNPTANKTLTRAGDAAGTSTGATLVRAGCSMAPARFSIGDEPTRKSISPAPSTSTPPAEDAQLNYAALDLEPRAVSAATSPRTYTQIDFARSEKLHAADAN